MKNPTGSACGKIILFGEHSVVYGHPAIAVPVTALHADVFIQPAETLVISSRNFNTEYEILKNPLNKNETGFGLQETVLNTLKFFNLLKKQNIHITIDSSILPASGLGSSAAVAVAIIRALSNYFKKKISNKDLYDLAFKTEVIYHGDPSGIDPAVIIHEKPVYFKSGKKTRLEPLKVANKIPIIIADTGVRSSTKEVVSDVKKARASDKDKYDTIFSEIIPIVHRVRDVIEKGNVSELGRLMNENHELLKQIDVSSPELDLLVESAREAGATGAKLAGAGRGGHIIALAEDNVQKISKALVDAGASHIFFTEIV